MIERKDLAGKTIRGCHIEKDGMLGPEISIEFTDDTVFSICLKTEVLLQAKKVGDPISSNPMRRL